MITSHRATIKDVARVSGTSLGTVSRYLNGQLDHSSVHFDNIKQAIRTLQYVPNIHARATREQSNCCIGMFLTDAVFSNNYWIQSIQTAMLASISNAGYRAYLQIVSGSEPTRKELELLANIDGLFLVGHFEPEFFQSLSQHYSLPVVISEEELNYAQGIQIKTDIRSGITQMIEHLLALEHQKIGVAAIDQNYSLSRRKLEIYLEEIRKYIPDYDLSLITQGNANAPCHKEGQRLTAELLDQHHDLTAIFYMSDSYVPGGFGELARRGLRVPEEISIVSYDDSFLASSMIPELTTMGVDYKLLADRMMAALLWMMEKKGKPQNYPGIITIPKTFQRRDSTALAQKWN